MSNEFYVGQEVVCVDDDAIAKYCIRGPIYVGDLDGLTKGNIYTIRAISLDPVCVCPALFLEQIVRSSLFGEPEIGFASRRFRPVVKTDISIFTAMLAPSPDRVSA
jgi:hypothetical protein